MTFPLPSTPILDTFNRPDQDPINLSGNWITPTPNTGTNVQVISNEAATTNSAGGSEVYWRRRFGPDCEVYVTCTVKPDNGNWFFLNLRIDNNDPPSAFVSAYFMLCTASAGTDVIQIWRQDNPGALLASVNLEFNSGDRFLFRAEGSTFTGYRDSGSGFVQIIQAVDATYNNAGWMSMQLKNSVVRLDDFGGGDLGTLPVYQRIHGIPVEVFDDGTEQVRELIVGVVGAP